jgi:hypothetical protein
MDPGGLRAGVDVVLAVAATFAAAAAVFFAYLGVRAIRRRVRLARDRRAYHDARFGPDGRPLPPSEPGVCERCGTASDTIYYLPSGAHVCPACHGAPPGGPGAPARPA